MPNTVQRAGRERTHESDGFLPEPIEELNIRSSSRAHLRQTSVDLARNFGDNTFQYRTGFFQAQQDSGDLYATLRYTPLYNKSKWIEGAVDLQLGLDGHFPFHDNYGSTIQGTGSLLLFLGSTQEIRPWFSLREGVEFNLYAIRGPSVALDGYVPIKTGLSAVIKAGAIEISAGTIAEFPIMPESIQDATSIRPIYEKISPFVSLGSGSMRFYSSIDLYRDSGDINLGLTYDFPFIEDGGKSHTLSLRTYATGQLWGDETYYDEQVMFSVMYGYANQPDRLRADVGMTLDPAAHGNKNYEIDTSFAPGGYYYESIFTKLTMFNGYEGEEVDAPIYDEQTGTFSFSIDGYIETTPVGQSWLNKLLSSCRAAGNNTWICGYDWRCGVDMVPCVHHELTVEESGDFIISDVSASYTCNYSTGDFFDAICKNESLDSFIHSLKSEHTLDKWEHLVKLAHLAYMTYNSTGRDNGFFNLGSEKVNTIGKQDIYTALKNLFTTGENSETTICRGFAQFITYVAHEWNLKANSVVISDNGSPHVIAVVKEFGKREYHFFNVGKQLPFSDQNETMLHALESYTRFAKMGPQRQFSIYSHDGKYLRRLETTYGAMLRARMTNQRLAHFLGANPQ